MIEVSNLCYYVPRGRDAIKLKPRALHADEDDGGLSNDCDAEKSSNKVHNRDNFIFCSEF